MSVRQKHYRFGTFRGEIVVRKTWFTDTLYFLYAVLVTILSFTAVMELNSAVHVGAVLIVAIFSILLLAKRNLQHFYIEWGSIRIGADADGKDDEDERETVQVEFRNE